MSLDLTDLGDVVAEFSATYTATRAGAIDYDTDPGKPTQAAGSTFSVTASVQPPSTKDLQRMPEGLRTEETRVLYTTTALQLEPQPDTVAIEGATWQVEQVEPWADVAGYYRAVVRKQVGA